MTNDECNKLYGANYLPDQSSKKTIVFHSHFLENSENVLNFTKMSNKFGE